jgi:hypothetical protein
MEPGPSHTFDAFRLEPPPGGLWRGDVRLALRPRSLAMLRYLGSQEQRPDNGIWPSRSKRQIFYGKEELWENLLMSPIPYSFQEQEDTRDSPRKGRHQVGHLLASVSSPPSFFIALTC